jgi:hypothetical protein
MREADVKRPVIFAAPLSLALMMAVALAPPASGAKKNLTPADAKKLTDIQKGLDVPLSVAECARLGCVTTVDNACPGVTTNYNNQVQTVHWKCDCRNGSAGTCIDKSE